MTMFDNISLSKTAFCLDQGIMTDKLYFYFIWKSLQKYDCTNYGFFLVSAALYPLTEKLCFQEYNVLQISQNPQNAIKRL